MGLAPHLGTPLTLNVPWGDVPTWLQAIATILALVFAAIAARTASRLHRIEFERDRVSAAERFRREERERQSQAVHITAWWGTDAARPQDYGTFIRNGSDAPVYQGHLYVVDPNDPNGGEQFDLPVIPPDVKPAFRPTRLSTPDAESNPHNYRIELSFTDSGGIRWLRDQRGRLSELRPTLVVWADVHRAEALRQFAREFLEAHHVQVIFRNGRLESLHDELISLRDDDPAPDIFIGSHDRIADLIRHDAIEPIALPAERQKMFSRLAIDGMTFDDKLYGVPYGIDTICLVRNLNLAPHEPLTFEHLLAHGQALQADGKVEFPLAIPVGMNGGAYYTYPLFASAGGMMFERDDDGRWDHNKIAFAAKGSIAAFRRLHQLGERGSGVLRRELDGEAANRLFAEGKTPYIISTSTAIEVARKAGIPVAASTVPRFAGALPARSLTMVQGFFLCRRGTNKVVAEDLISDYMTKTEVALALHQIQPRPPALLSALNLVTISDSLVREWQKICADGELMPSFAYNSETWRAFSAAEAAVVGGADPEATARDLAASMAKLVTRTRQSVSRGRRSEGRND